MGLTTGCGESGRGGPERWSGLKKAATPEIKAYVNVSMTRTALPVSQNARKLPPAP